MDVGFQTEMARLFQGNERNGLQMVVIKFSERAIMVRYVLGPWRRWGVQKLGR